MNSPGQREARKDFTSRAGYPLIGEKIAGTVMVIIFAAVIVAWFIDFARR